MKKTHTQTAEPLVIPNWMVWVQCICFSVLYAIWALPETILIRHICLIIGALIGLYEIYQYRNLFWQKRAIPVWLLVGLFAWATFHLIFLSNDFDAQYLEYTTIWKRAAIGAIFALGFGIALANNSLSKKEGQALWALFYLGLLAPTIIYLIKYFLMHYGIPHGWVVPEYWQLYYSSAPFYLPKTVYVCFCLPILSIALGLLAQKIQQGQLLKLSSLFYVATIPATLFIFYRENIKNGLLYSAVLLTFVTGILVLHQFRRYWLCKTAVVTVVLLIGGLFINHNIQSNSSWATFVADTKIALDIQAYQQWRYNGEKGYPNNELGSMVSPTSYERIAWGMAGVQLIKENLLGYGLIERSFGQLAKINWPDSKLHQSHSGWIDLTLGIGTPGLLLVVTLLCTLLFQLARSKNQVILSVNPYKIALWWALFGLGMIWCTTEISQKVYFDSLIFWIALGLGVIVIGLPKNRHVW